VAAQTAAMRPDAVSGLLLITPFDSLRSIARSHFPAFPLWPFIRDRYDSIGALRSYDGPVVVLVAGKDEVVPPRLGRNLYESYHGPKKLLEQEAGHNTLDLSPLSGWWQEAFQFLKEQSVVTRM
jgi:pimeloyl-ACP methyl ester carboxylesterase